MYQALYIMVERFHFYLVCANVCFLYHHKRSVWPVHCPRLTLDYIVYCTTAVNVWSMNNNFKLCTMYYWSRYLLCCRQHFWIPCSMPGCWSMQWMLSCHPPDVELPSPGCWVAIPWMLSCHPLDAELPSPECWVSIPLRLSHHPQDAELPSPWCWVTIPWMLSYHPLDVELPSPWCWVTIPWMLS